MTLIGKPQITLLGSAAEDDGTFEGSTITELRVPAAVRITGTLTPEGDVAVTGLLSTASALALAPPAAVKVAAGGAGNADYFVRGDPTAGAFAVALPSAVGIAGRVYKIRKSVAHANALTIAPAGTETIDGNPTATVADLKTVEIISDGANWLIVGTSD